MSPACVSITGKVLSEDSTRKWYHLHWGARLRNIGFVTINLVLISPSHYMIKRGINHYFKLSYMVWSRYSKTPFAPSLLGTSALSIYILDCRRCKSVTIIYSPHFLKEQNRRGLCSCPGEVKAWTSSCW